MRHKDSDEADHATANHRVFPPYNTPYHRKQNNTRLATVTRCRSLQMDCLPRSSFLSLPQSIRRRIYLEAGLPVDRNIDLNQWINRKNREIGTVVRFAVGRPSTNPYACTHNLLLTCRLLYAEASALVYSANRFFIRYRDTKSLKALRNLTESSLACLTHLTIHLNVTSCESSASYDGSDLCCVSCYRTTICTCSQHDKPLGTSFHDKAVLFEWQSAARYLATNIKPYSLDLYFVADVEDLETGQLVVQPLRGIPTLADCSIRLHRMHHPLLQALAVETATRAKGRQYLPKEDSSPFRFLDLPPELRLRILEYTDLVTPCREVEWNPKDNFYLHYAGWACAESEGEWGWCQPSDHHACQFRKCCEIARRGVGCFCHRYHTAFTSKCRCWIPPTPLFLVCQVLQQDAQVVFFTKNHFIIAPAAGCTHLAESSPDHLEASIFLKDVVPSTALRYLRSLEIVFPCFSDDYMRLGEPAYQQWLQVIEHMCQLNLTRLSLSVVMADPPLARGMGEIQCRGTMSKEQATRIFRMYSRTLRPLSRLRENGLQAFFATLSSPYKSVVDGTYAEPYPWPEPLIKFQQRVKDQILHFTQRMERGVMGEDYDSSLLQEKAHGQSQWLKGKILADNEC